MNAYNRALWKESRGTAPLSLCDALHFVRDIFQALKDDASGWRFWLRYVLSAAIAILDALIKERCAS